MYVLKCHHEVLHLVFGAEKEISNQPLSLTILYKDFHVLKAHYSKRWHKVVSREGGEIYDDTGHLGIILDKHPHSYPRLSLSTQHCRHSSHGNRFQRSRWPLLSAISSVKLALNPIYKSESVLHMSNECSTRRCACQKHYEYVYPSAEIAACLQ